MANTHTALQIKFDFKLIKIDVAVVRQPINVWFIGRCWIDISVTGPRTFSLFIILIVRLLVRDVGNIGDDFVAATWTICAECLPCSTILLGYTSLSVVPRSEWVSHHIQFGSHGRVLVQERHTCGASDGRITEKITAKWIHHQVAVQYTRRAAESGVGGRVHVFLFFPPQFLGRWLRMRSRSKTDCAQLNDRLLAFTRHEWWFKYRLKK